MAVLGATTLTGCVFIEQFLGGTDPGTGTGYRCIFNSTNPSTSWTKETSLAYNDAALRVITGTGAGTGGSTAFATVLSSGKSIGLSVQSGTAGVTFQPSQPANVSANASPLFGQGTSPGLSGASLADLPFHTHTFDRHAIVTTIPTASVQKVNATLTAARQTGNGGSSTQHTHTVSGGTHTHGITSNHTHTIGGSHGHTPPVPGTQENFAVLYRDVIIARKDVKP